MMYGAETWAVKKTQERKLDIWMCGVIKMGTIRYDGIKRDNESGVTIQESAGKKIIKVVRTCH